MAWAHGGSSYNNHACRCEVCRAAWAKRYADYRKRRRARGICVDCPELSKGMARCMKCRRRASALMAQRRAAA